MSKSDFILMRRSIYISYRTWCFSWVLYIVNINIMPVNSSTWSFVNLSPLIQWHCSIREPFSSLFASVSGVAANPLPIILRFDCSVRAPQAPQNDTMNRMLTTEPCHCIQLNYLSLFQNSSAQLSQWTLSRTHLFIAPIPIFNFNPEIHRAFR